jgi:hypothetical protein
MVAGRGTFIDDLLRRCGLDNVAVSPESARYPKMTVDGLRSAGLDVLLLSSEPHPFGERDRELWSRRLPYQANISPSTRHTSTPGSRLLKAVDYFRGLVRQVTVGPR